MWGDIYQVKSPETVLPAFDAYEACSPDWPEPHEFMLRKVPVLLEEGTEIAAHTYLYTWDVTNAQHVPSGRWTQVARDVR